jgi:RNA polymerase sigma factor (TIGR02999 family)
MMEIPPSCIPVSSDKKYTWGLTSFGKIGAGMIVEGPRDVSGLIVAWGDGDEEALGRLMAALYPELRRIARRHLGRRPPGQSLESAALANEAYLKLKRSGGIRCENRLHFLALCSQIIRRILVDYARARGFSKRGGDWERVTLAGIVFGPKAQELDILALHEALDALAGINARQARVVELRYFGGLSVEETAEVLGITRVRVKRDWQIAKSWLYGVLIGQEEIGIS